MASRTAPYLPVVVRRLPPVPIKSCAAHAAQLAPHICSTLRPPCGFGPLRNQRADRFPPTFMRRKASAEKIQFQLLLPNFTFQLRNPLPRRQQLPTSGHRAPSALIFRHYRSRPSCSPMRQASFARFCIAVLPYIQPLPSYADLLRYRTYTFPSQHPAHRRQLQLRSVLRLLRFLLCDMCSPCRELSPLSLSQFWGALQFPVPRFPLDGPTPVLLFAWALMPLATPAFQDGRSGSFDKDKGRPHGPP